MSEPSQKALRSAKAILSDGKWSHNHYSQDEMENLIAKALDAALLRQQQRKSGDPLRPKTLEAKWLDPECWEASDNVITDLEFEVDCKRIVEALNNASLPTSPGNTESVEAATRKGQEFTERLIRLSENDAKCLRDFIGEDEPCGASEITLSIGLGHSGFGLYVNLTEYPEEGSLFFEISKTVKGSNV